MKKIYIVIILIAMTFLLGCLDLGEVGVVPIDTITPSVTPTMEVPKIKNFLYQLQNLDINKVKDTDFDLVIMDYSKDGSDEEKYTEKEIESLKKAPHKKIVIAYLSIGEAEDYRYYFKDEWHTNPPDFLEEENPFWPGNYKVKYWDKNWQNIIFGKENSYLDKIIAQGFDGVYLDKVDAYEDYEDERDSAKKDMIDFVMNLAEYARKKKKNFYIIPQNAEELLEDEKYRKMVNGIGVESLFYNGREKPNPKTYIENREKYLDLIVKTKWVLVTEYVQKKNLIKDVYEKAKKKGYIPYCTVIDLDQLIINDIK